MLKNGDRVSYKFQGFPIPYDGVARRVRAMEGGFLADFHWWSDKGTVVEKDTAFKAHMKVAKESLAKKATPYDSWCLLDESEADEAEVGEDADEEEGEEEEEEVEEADDDEADAEVTALKERVGELEQSQKALERKVDGLVNAVNHQNDNQPAIVSQITHMAIAAERRRVAALPAPLPNAKPTSCFNYRNGYTCKGTGTVKNGATTPDTRGTKLTWTAARGLLLERPEDVALDKMFKGDANAPDSPLAALTLCSLCMDDISATQYLHVRGTGFNCMRCTVPGSCGTLTKKKLLCVDCTNNPMPCGQSDIDATVAAIKKLLAPLALATGFDISVEPEVNVAKNLRVDIVVVCKDADGKILAKYYIEIDPNQHGKNQVDKEVAATVARVRALAKEQAEHGYKAGLFRFSSTGEYKIGTEIVDGEDVDVKVNTDTNLRYIVLREHLVSLIRTCTKRINPVTSLLVDPYPLPPVFVLYMYYDFDHKSILWPNHEHPHNVVGITNVPPLIDHPQVTGLPDWACMLHPTFLRKSPYAAELCFAARKTYEQVFGYGVKHAVLPDPEPGDLRSGGARSRKEGGPSRDAGGPSRGPNQAKKAKS